MLELDYTLIKISCEALSSHFQRVRKQVTRELGQVLSILQQQQGGTKKDTSAAADAVAASSTAPSLTTDVLAQLQTRLRHLREALLVADAQEKEILACCYKKLQAIAQQGGGGESEVQSSSPSHSYHGQGEASKKQLERMIGEYLLRRGYLEGLALLEQEAWSPLPSSSSKSNSTPTGLFDLDLFLRCKEVESQLEKNRDCTSALNWCADHASRLRRLNSPLEFQLHKRQFLELVRQGQRLQAINYASQHLSPSMTAANSTSNATAATASGGAEQGQEHLLQVQQAMATLAFEHPDTCPIPEYTRLFAPERWRELTQLFAEEAMRCYGMIDPYSTLEVCVQAGLTALKTPLCKAPSPPGARQKKRKNKKKKKTGENEESEKGKDNQQSRKKDRRSGGEEHAREEGEDEEEDSSSEEEGQEKDAMDIDRDSDGQQAQDKEKGKGKKEKNKKKKKSDDEDEDGSGSANCPVCSSAGHKLAQGLPFAHFGNSYLMCRCTGEKMDGENPPMVLPNGRVYSRKAIKDILCSSSPSGEGGVSPGTGKEGEPAITCPRTGDTFPLSEVQNIFII